MNKQLSPAQMKANEQQKKLYRYRLMNGNTFSSFERITATQKVGGSCVKELIEIVKPQVIK